MTTPPPVVQETRWYLRPRVALPAIAVVVLVVALLTPERIAGRSGDSRLSTFSTQPQGAQLLHDLAQRLGWHVQQARDAELRADSTAIVAVLDPPIDLRKPEVHRVLDRVRAGGGLLYVLGAGSAMSDSLHVGRGVSGTGESTGAKEGCPVNKSVFEPLWPGNQSFLNSARFRTTRPDSAIEFVPFRRDSLPSARGAIVTRAGALRHGAVGFPLGRGRVVVIADPDVLRNDVLRSCEYGLDIVSVRMLEYLSAGGPTPRTQLVFDEYHQGYGPQGGTVRTIASYLRGTPSGRTLLQLIAALLVLLAAAAPRILAPVASDNIERRSPLEHVDALARAYAAVGATRTASSLLLRGVRRRFERGAIRSASREADDAFLDHVRQTTPARSDDVALVRRAIKNASPAREFLAVGAALERIEHSLTDVS